MHTCHAMRCEMHSNEVLQIELIASLGRCVESLDDLIRHYEDPGVEALGAVYEARTLLRQLDS